MPLNIWSARSRHHSRSSGIKKPKTKTLRAKAWKLLSECIRREAANQEGYVTCYTCGRREHWKDVDAGHAISGRHNGVLFDERLIRPQCRYDNRRRNGYYEVFVPKLMKENLWTYEDWAAIEAESRGKHEITRGEYEDMMEGYKQRLEGQCGQKNT